MSSDNGEMTMRGREQVRAGLRAFWQSFGTLQHGTDIDFVHEALNHHPTSDSRSVTIRAVAWIDRDPQGKVISLRVDNDQSPLWTDAR